jgi:hypothetical protein
MRTSFGFDFAPVLPLWLIAALGAACLLALVPALLRRARGAWWRALAFALILAALSGPRLVEETRETRPDIALLLVDRSDSTRAGLGHAEAIEAARRGIEARMARLRDVELRVAEIPEAAPRARSASPRWSAPWPTSRPPGWPG